ncbi:MAG TPA: class I SAM-dependent methyltransferase [Saprospiraceae bacterium]|nr:class I SAM-dependent methyltransferase [Saprospiraceae bacterium]
MMENRKKHWEKIYSDKVPAEVSWTQDIPQTSLNFLHSFNLPKTASIIDIGGGDSRFVDYLLEEGYENITVLDISEKALEKAKERLGSNATRVNWITSDITEFRSSTTYDCWHDRATFHFLIQPDEIKSYLTIAKQAVKGYMIIGTFSENGPDQCSRLDVHQYSEEELQRELVDGFEKLKCITEDHITPFKTKQNFLFCSFKRLFKSDQRLN